ncbi:TPA: hypothetical protein HA351_03340 [Methanosarcinaceae archaeon]|nr:hypothetical protein [Methanosarcinaceae archaeon]
MMAAIEKVRLEGKALGDIFKEDFLNKIAYSGENIFPINVAFVREFERDGKLHASLITFSHQNNAEVKNKVLHLESEDPELLDIFLKIIEGKHNGKGSENKS